MILSSAGVISGTPSVAGTFEIVLGVRDSYGNGGGVPLLLTVQPLAISPTTLPTGAVGSAYSQSLTAIGGKAPYTWSVVAGPLPAGLSLSATGTISGKPTTASSQTFDVSVSDSSGLSVSQMLTLTIVQAQIATIQITTGPTRPAGIVGTFYSQLLLASGGTLPYSWSLVSGTLPPGLILSSVGAISGTPTTAGTSTFTAKVTDAASNTQTQSFSITVGLPFIGSIPHLAAEGGWNTTFTMVNKGTASAQTQLNLFDDNGNPLPLTLAFPQQASSVPTTEASVSQTLAPNTSLIVDASGPSNVAYLEGSAQLNAAGTVDGFAIFHYDPTQQEAVVPMETRNAESYLMPFDNTNSVLTGVALENVSNTAANIPMIVRTDAGVQIIATTIALPAFGHTSFVLSTQYTATTNIRGTVEFDTPGFGSSNAGQISVLGIRYTGGTLTTIPVLANVGTSGGLMAHLVSGNGWQTTFALVNTGTASASATLNFYADTGAAQSLPLTVLEGGATSTVSSITQTITPNASVWIQSAAPATGPLLSGSTQLTTTGNVSGYAIFRYNPNGQEAVVPLESRNAGKYLIAFDNTNNTTTGVALNAIVSQAVNVPVVIRDDAGNQLETGAIPLSANGHTSFLLATQYPQTVGLRGTVEFDTPTGAEISVLGIRSPPALTFTTLPPLAK